MPAVQRGQVLKLKSGGWAARWRDRYGRRLQRGGFATRSEARRFLDEELARKRRGGTVERITFGELVGRFLEAHAPGREPSTIKTLEERLRRPSSSFGDVQLAELSGMVMELAAWQTTIPPGYRHAVMGATRQVLDAAVRWKLIDENPARALGANPEPKRGEVPTFRSDAEVDALAAALGRVYGAAVVLATETGLRPSEWLALRWSSVALDEQLVFVLETFAKGQRKDYGKTARSRRAVPLTARASNALRALDTARSGLVFPAPAGGHIDLNNYRRRVWVPALAIARLPSYRIYATRHRFAAVALDAGVSIFELSRLMGTGVPLIDRTYGHLVRDSFDRAREKLDARARREYSEYSQLAAAS